MIETIMVCVLCGTEYSETVEVCDVCAKSGFLRSTEGADRTQPDPAAVATES